MYGAWIALAAVTALSASQAAGQSTTLTTNGVADQVNLILRSSSPVNHRVTLELGDWQIGQAQKVTGEKDLFFYHGVTRQMPLRIGTDAQIYNAWAWDKAAPDGDGYGKIGSAMNTALFYGEHAAATGTGIAHQTALTVYNMGRPGHGRNEVAADYSYVMVRGDGSVAAGQNFWNSDHTLSTPVAARAADRPHYIVGQSLRVINMSAGAQQIDGEHAGAFGQSIVTTPHLADELAQMGAPASARSYPILALQSLAGFSGTANVQDGSQSGADYGAYYALRVGGGGGSAYLASSARSRFGIGVGVYDWDRAGIEIADRLPNGTGPGIRNRYATELGGLQGEGQPAVLIKAEAGRREGPAEAIRFGDTADFWAIMRSIAPAGDDRFGIYSGAARRFAFAATTEGVAFNGAAPRPRPTLPPPLATDGTASPAALATMMNAIRSALIQYGLAR